MIPSNKWFPGSLPARAMWATNFSLRFAEVGPGLGFTAAQITSAQNDMNVIRALANIDEQLKAYAEAMRQYRIVVTEGAVGEPNPTLPANPTFGIETQVPTGIFQRLSGLRDRILTNPAYTDEIGALLGILSDSPAPPPEIKPVIKVTPQFSGYKFDVVTTRQGMQAFKVLIRRMDSEAWTEAGFGTSSPLTVTVTPHTTGQSERLQVCIQLIDKNQPVGVPSDVVYVTVNP